VTAPGSRRATTNEPRSHSVQGGRCAAAARARRPPPWPDLPKWPIGGRQHGDTLAKTRPSVQKRLRGAREIEKKQIKAARKADRDAQKAARPERGDIDPDLVGITPGPQPIPWADDV
jgi:hypothetical protein